MTLRLEMARRELDLMKPIPNKAKDMHYYKTLFDRYFGPNHVLSQDISYQRLQRLVPKFTAPCSCTRKLVDQPLPLIHCTRSVVASVAPENPTTGYNKSELQQQGDVPTAKGANHLVSNQLIQSCPLTLSQMKPKHLWDAYLRSSQFAYWIFIGFAFFCPACSHIRFFSIIVLELLVQQLRWEEHYVKNGFLSFGGVTQLISCLPDFFFLYSLI